MSPPPRSASALVALIVGLARPVRDEKVPSDEAIVMLVVDVSASMEATDVAPSRMQAAQEAAARFVEGVPDKFQVGLIAFDGSTRVLATPTTDHADRDLRDPQPRDRTGNGRR